MNGTGLVSIILLNYNGKKFNVDCINSILKQTYTKFKIIFVNNMSTDGSLEEVQSVFKDEIKRGKIKIIYPNDNLYFAGGNNFGVKNASKESEYIRLLNNDVIIDKYCLEKLINGISSDKHLGAVSSLILDKGFEDKIKQKSDEGMVRTTNIFGIQIREHVKTKNNIFYTTFLCGCSLLYKKDIVNFPFFDFYKIYAEDLQFSRELLLKGYKLGICTDSILYHLGSATMGKVPYKKLYLNFRNVMIDYKCFTTKKLRVKLAPLNFLIHILQIFTSGNVKQAIKAKIDASRRIKENYDKLDTVKLRINNESVISFDDFYTMLTYRIASDDLHSSKLKLYMVDILNFIGKIYYILLQVPYCK